MNRIVAANWKMHLTLDEARALYGSLEATRSLYPNVSLIAFPPFTALATLAALRKADGPALGAQNCHAEPRGAFTGEISAEQARDAGAEYVLVCHSERRRLFCESDATARAKLGAAWRAGITPLLCVGETLSERERHETRDILTRQLERALDGAPQRSRLLVAYEPVWAIGTGVVATTDQVAEAHGWIREILGKLGRMGEASPTPVLYGGSVDPKNAGPLSSLPEVDGFLVGGASLAAPSFLAIAAAQEAAAEARTG